MTSHNRPILAARNALQILAQTRAAHDRLIGPINRMVAALPKAEPIPSLAEIFKKDDN